MTSNRFVSLILPIRNESHYIEQCLDAIFEQDYNHANMELIIVDGISTDDTNEIVLEYIKNHQSIPTRLISNRRQIVSTGMNLAIKKASGDIIVRIDGHCIVAPDYVRQCVAVLDETGADCVGGMQTGIGQTRIGVANALTNKTPFGIGNAKFHYASKPDWVDTVYLGAYKKKVFEKIGYFDEELIRNQDDEFNFRLRQAGGRIRLDQRISSTYYNRGTLIGLFNQYFLYGMYKVRVIQKRGSISSWRHLVPGLFVLSTAVSIFIAAIFRITPVYFCVLGPYLLANTIASLSATRSNLSNMPFVMLSFSVMHLSYGLGFIWGFWKWRKSWHIKQRWT